MSGDTAERKMLRTVVAMVIGALLCGALAAWGLLHLAGVL